MEHVTRAQMKMVRSLQIKKYRDELKMFVAEGDKCINELKKTYQIVLLCDHNNTTQKEIEQMSGLKNPQGSIAVFKTDSRAQHTNDTQTDLILALDGVQDPGNMGTIIRTADWFGIRQIICSTDTADCYNPKVVQATMGALARVEILYTDLPQWLTDKKDNHCPIYGTLLDGENIYSIQKQATDSTEPSRKGIIVMGNEGNGISPAVRQLITHAIRIPSFPPNAETSESLNVAIATAITLAEFRRPKD